MKSITEKSHSETYYSNLPFSIIEKGKRQFKLFGQDKGFYLYELKPQAIFGKEIYFGAFNFQLDALERIDYLTANNITS